MPAHHILNCMRLLTRLMKKGSRLSMVAVVLGGLGISLKPIAFAADGASDPRLLAQAHVERPRQTDGPIDLDRTGGPSAFPPSPASSASASRVAPDLQRRKEPLEAFPLEEVKVVGTMETANETFAVVKAGGVLYRVRKGNYIGQNLGLITEITASQVKIKELVTGTTGDWLERQRVLPLGDRAEPGKR